MATFNTSVGVDNSQISPALTAALNLFKKYNKSASESALIKLVVSDSEAKAKVEEFSKITKKAQKELSKFTFEGKNSNGSSTRKSFTAQRIANLDEKSIGGMLKELYNVRDRIEKGKLTPLNWGKGAEKQFYGLISLLEKIKSTSSEITRLQGAVTSGNVIKTRRRAAIDEEKIEERQRKKDDSLFKREIMTKKGRDESLANQKAIIDDRQKEYDTIKSNSKGTIKDIEAEIAAWNRLYKEKLRLYQIDAGHKDVYSTPELKRMREQRAAMVANLEQQKQIEQDRIKNEKEAKERAKADAELEKKNYSQNKQQAIRNEISDIDSKLSSNANDPNKNVAERAKEEIRLLEQKYQKLKELAAATKDLKDKERIENDARSLKGQLDNARILEQERKKKDALAASNKRLQDAEQKYYQAKKLNDGTPKGIKTEIAALNELIRKKEQNLRLQQGTKNYVADSQMQGYQNQLRTLQTQLQNVSASTGQATNNIDILGGAISKAGQLFARFFGVQQVVQFAKKVAETTGYFQQQRIALEQIVGSIGKADELLSQIMEFALQSPLQTKELINFTKKLSAFSIPTNELFDTVKRLADLSVGLGVDMDRIVLAYGQVKSAAFLRGQEVRQFTEAGFPILDKLAEKFSQIRGEIVSAGEVFDLISERSVPFEMVAEVIKDATSEGGKFYKMQERQMDTIYGQMQKIKDLWTLELNNQGGRFSETIKNIIELIQKLIKHFTGVAIAISTAFITNGISQWIIKLRIAKAESRAFQFTMQSIASVASMAFGVIVGLITDAISKITDVNRALENVNETYQRQLDNTIDGLNSIMATLNEAGEGTKEYQEAVDKLTTNYSQYMNVNDEVINQLKTMTDTYYELIDAIKIYNTYQNDKAIIKAAKDKVLEEFDWDDWDLEIEDLFKFDAFGANNKYNTRVKYGANMELQYKNVLRSVLSELLDNRKWVKGEIDRKDTFEKLLEKRINQVLPNFTNDHPITDDAYKRLWSELLGTVSWSANLKAYENLFYAYGAYDNPFDKMFLETDEKFKNVKETQLRTINRKKLDDGTYDDYDYNQKAQIEYLKAFKELLPNFNIDGLDANGKSAFTNLDKAIQSGINIFNTNTIHDILTLSKTFSESLGEVDDTAKTAFSHLIKMFKEEVEEMSKQSAIVNATIRRDFGPDSEEYKKNSKVWGIAKQYLPNMKNYRDKRKSLVERHDAVKKEIEQYEKSGNSHTQYAQQDYENKKLELYVLEKLMEGKQQNDLSDGREASFFDTKEKSTKTIHKEPSHELADLIINAFKTYRNLSQNGIGPEMAKLFLRTDEEFEKFRGFFDANAKIVNAEGKELKVGSITAQEAFKNIFLSDGIDEGVIDFNAAMELVINALKNGTKEEQKYANHLRSTWEQLINKSKADAYIKVLQNEFEKLNRDIANANDRLQLYRELQKKGILYEVQNDSFISNNSNNTFAGRSVLPKSKQIENDLLGLISFYNAQIKRIDPNETMTQSPLLGINNVKLDSLEELEVFIERLTKTINVNNRNFSSAEFGKLSENITKLAKELRSQKISEISNRTGKQFTGNVLEDLIANYTNSVNGQTFTAAQGQIDDTGLLVSMIDEAKKGADEIMQRILEEAKRSVLSDDGFIVKPIDIDQITQRLDEIINNEKTPAPMRQALKEQRSNLVDKAKEYNAMIGSGEFKNISDFFNAAKIGQKRYQELVDNNTAAQGKARKSREDYQNANKELQEIEKQNRAKIEEQTGQLLAAKKELENDPNSQDLKIKISTLEDSIKKLTNAIEERAAKAGEARIQAQADAAVAAQTQHAVDNTSAGQEARDARNKAATNLKKAATTSQQKLNEYKDVVLGLAQAFQKTISMVEHFYNVFNDGESPDWMKEVDGFLSDFTENFEQLIGPMTAIIGLVITLASAMITLDIAMTPVLIAIAAIVAAAAIIAGIIAAIQAHDRRLERQIEDTNKAIEKLENEITNLDALAERQTGIQKMTTELDALSNSYEKAQLAAQNANDEFAKKHTDWEKYNEFMQQSQSAMDEFVNGVKEMTDSITSGVEDWADSMESAIRSAFQNGENAARAFRSSIKEMIGDIVSQMIKVQILQPVIESAMESWTHANAMREDDSYYVEKTIKNEDGSTRKVKELNSEKYLKDLFARLGDDDLAREYYEKMLNLGDEVSDGINGLPQFLKDAYMSNGEGASLNGGIESITEDTARRIEALSNSQLAEVIAVRQYIEQMQFTSSTYYSGISATVLSINNKAEEIYSQTRAILEAIEQVRMGVRPLHVISA